MAAIANVPSQHSADNSPKAGLEVEQQEEKVAAIKITDLNQIDQKKIKVTLK